MQTRALFAANPTIAQIGEHQLQRRDDACRPKQGDRLVESMVPGTFSAFLRADCATATPGPLICMRSAALWPGLMAATDGIASVLFGAADKSDRMRDDIAANQKQTTPCQHEADAHCTSLGREDSRRDTPAAWSAPRKP